MGYGATFKSGVKLCKYDLIGMIDGDDEYDMEDMIVMPISNGYPAGIYVCSKGTCHPSSASKSDAKRFIESLND